MLITWYFTKHFWWVEQLKLSRNSYSNSLGSHHTNLASHGVFIILQPNRVVGPFGRLFLPLSDRTLGGLNHLARVWFPPIVSDRQPFESGCYACAKADMWGQPLDRTIDGLNASTGLSLELHMLSGTSLDATKLSSSLVRLVTIH
jgi:hypothetical protein